jgi:hypothetical protein
MHKLQSLLTFNIIGFYNILNMEHRKPLSRVLEKEGINQVIFALEESGPNNVIPWNQIRGQFPDLISSEDVRYYIGRAKPHFVEEGLEISKIPHPDDKDNPGYYVETRSTGREPVLLVENELRYQERSVQLSEDERKLFFKLKSGRFTYMSDIQGINTDEDGATEGWVQELISTLSTKLEELQLNNAITATIDSGEYGPCVRMRGISATCVSGEVPGDRLDALLSAVAFDQPIDKTIELLGNTKEGKRYNRAQAWRAVVNAYGNVVARERNGVATPDEVTALDILKDHLYDYSLDLGVVPGIIKEYFEIGHK